MVILSLLFCIIFAFCAVLSAFVLSWLGLALNVVAAVLAVLNGALLIACLLGRHFWKKSGRMEKTYIDSFTGWRRGGLLFGKYALAGLAIWEALVVALCILYLIIQPLGLN